MKNFTKSAKKYIQTIFGFLKNDLKSQLIGYAKKFSALPSKDKVKVIALVSVVLIAVISTSSFVKDRIYLQQIKDQKYESYFANENVALSQGKAFCDKLRSGSAATGYGYQKIAAANFCPEFVEGFKVVLTNKQKQALLVKQLRAAGLAGKYSSEIEAVTNAQAVCRTLREGGVQQGPLESQIAMKLYCPEFTNGYRLLKPIVVKAKFVIRESYPDSWYPSIWVHGGQCEGNYGYNDIGPSTSVKITGDKGQVLAKTTLGKGKGTWSKCTFTYTLTVLEGEKTYNLEIGKRGTLQFTETELKIPGRLDSGL